jgi:DNA-binding NarL/FixJ family response regulator
MTTAVQVEKKTISVVIIEDFKLTRVGLRCALNSNDDIKVVAESDNALDGLELIKNHKPDIVLMDLGLAGMNGIEATLKVQEFDKNIKVIALTSHDREEEVIAALSSGAMAYCLKDIDPSKLADVIRDVVEGVCWLDPLVARKVLDAFPKQETLGILRDKSSEEGRSSKKSGKPFNL